ncbi:addiction module protein [Brevundimonas sp.]|uniref:addiction module protein n=1 Tax=Brevundimonas sp. TaxID=1871086 RepID=UPI001A1FBDCD|nr:addiction module protein [Brevundimonas sp.]MBJ7485011.1 addiction module protein [Brevundimonas sp.]
MIHVSVPDELEQLVADLPQDLRQSLDAVLRDAIEEYLWDQKHGEIALKRLADIDAGRTKTIPLEQVLADYGLSD